MGARNGWQRPRGRQARASPCIAEGLRKSATERPINSELSRFIQPSQNRLKALKVDFPVVCIVQAQAARRPEVSITQRRATDLRGAILSQ